MVGIDDDLKMICDGRFEGKGLNTRFVANLEAEIRKVGHEIEACL